MALSNRKSDPIVARGYPAKDLLLDLFAANRGPLAIGVLVESARLFGFSEGSVRVALSRLVSSGTVERGERDGQSLYGLTPQAERTNARIREHVYGEHRLPWSGEWLLVSIACPVHAKDQRQAFQRELESAHFRSLNRGLWLRPANVRVELEDALAEIRRVGSADVFVGAPTRGSDLEARVPELWPVDELATAMRAALDELEESQRRVAERSRERALVETFQLGTQAFRLVAADPLLPLELLPADWSGEELRRVLVDYNHLACDLWSATRGVEPARNPRPRRA